MIKKYALMFLLLASSGFCAKGAFSPIQSLPNNYNGGILENISSTYINLNFGFYAAANSRSLWFKLRDGFLLCKQYALNPENRLTKKFCGLR